MGSRGPFPLAHSTETLRGRNTFRPESRPAIPEDVQPPDWLDGAARATGSRQRPRSSRLAVCGRR